MNARWWFFDLDGTLADTDGDIRLAWRGAMEELGLVCDDFDSRFVAGPPIEEMAKTLFPTQYTDGMGDALRAAFARRYDSDGLPLTREYPGVMERVRALRAAGCVTAIVTNKRFAGAKAVMAKFGWADDFDALYAGDMFAADPAVGKLKKPALLARAMRDLGADAARSVIVGDTRSDFEAARACAIASVGVAWGYGTAAELALAGRIARSPSEI